MPAMLERQKEKKSYRTRWIEAEREAAIRSFHNNYLWVKETPLPNVVDKVKPKKRRVKPL